MGSTRHRSAISIAPVVAALGLTSTCGISNDPEQIPLASAGTDGEAGAGGGPNGGTAGNGGPMGGSGATSGSAGSSATGSGATSGSAGTGGSAGGGVGGGMCDGASTLMLDNFDETNTFDVTNNRPCSESNCHGNGECTTPAISSHNGECVGFFCSDNPKPWLCARRMQVSPAEPEDRVLRLELSDDPNDSDTVTGAGGAAATRAFAGYQIPLALAGDFRLPENTHDCLTFWIRGDRLPSGTSVEVSLKDRADFETASKIKVRTNLPKYSWCKAVIQVTTLKPGAKMGDEDNLDFGALKFLNLLLVADLEEVSWGPSFQAAVDINDVALESCDCANQSEDLCEP